MEILTAVANKLKCRFTDIMQENLIIQNYGIKSCRGKGINPCNDIRLQIIFISNIKYLCLSQEQLDKIEVDNYRICSQKKKN